MKGCVILDISGFKALSDSLDHYCRITDDKLSGDFCSTEHLVEKLYVDLLPNEGVLHAVLDKRTTFLVGCKGTGKSTLFARAQHDIRSKKKDISVYINAQSIFKYTESNSSKDQEIHVLSEVFSNEEIFKISLIRDTIMSMKESLYEELSLEPSGFFDLIGNSFRAKKLEGIFKEIDHLTKNPMIKEISRVVVEKNQSENTAEIIAEIKASLGSVGISSTSGIGGKTSISENKAYDSILAKFFNVGNIVSKFIEILDICNRQNIYLFIDDYSELSEQNRKLFMKTIIEPFYYIGTDKLNIKVSAYPNRYSPIDLDPQKYEILEIDLYNIYGKQSKISETEKKAIGYTERILENRASHYSDSQITDYFDISSSSMDTYYRLLYRSSNNIPRKMGAILKLCYRYAILEGKKITNSVLQDSIKKHYEDKIQPYFGKCKNSKSVNIDEKIDIFVQESLLQDIVRTAQEYKKELPKKQSNSYFKGLVEANTSHFAVSHEISEYLEELEFNGLMHRLNSIASKGPATGDLINKTNYIYALNYGLCISEKILYGKPDEKDTKYYQQRVFLYDDIIMNSLSKNKKIECKACGSVFKIEELDVIRKFRMRCMSCDEGFCEVVYDKELYSKAKSKIDSSKYTEEEIEIMMALNKAEETFKARELSLETDYSSQSIAWKCRKLEGYGMVKIHVNNPPYRYELTERGNQYVENIKSN